MERYQIPPQTLPRIQNVTLTPEELTELLKRASARESQSMQTREVATIEEALQTANELGISREHVLAEIAELRDVKSRDGRIERMIARRRDSFVRFAGLTLLVGGGLTVLIGFSTAKFALFGMSIALFVLGLQWWQARGALKNPHAVIEPVDGECRVCGKNAVSDHAKYCAEHRIT